MALNDDLDAAQCNADWCVRKPGTPRNLFRPDRLRSTGGIGDRIGYVWRYPRDAGRMLSGWAFIDVR